MPARIISIGDLLPLPWPAFWWCSCPCLPVACFFHSYKEYADAFQVLLKEAYSYLLSAQVLTRNASYWQISDLRSKLILIHCDYLGSSSARKPCPTSLLFSTTSSPGLKKNLWNPFHHPERRTVLRQLPPWGVWGWWKASMKYMSLQHHFPLYPLITDLLLPPREKEK